MSPLDATAVSSSAARDADDSPLSDAERDRYARHLALPQVGEAGQQRLRQARVLIIGMGGLGCPVATMLTAAGVGRLGLVDADVVTRSNLQRQTLFGTDDIGRPKVVVARERLRDLNPHITLDLHPTMFKSLNAVDLLRGYDLVVDATDNFSARYAINDACLRAGVPNVFGCIYQFSGRVTIFGAPESTAENSDTNNIASPDADATMQPGPCYRCVFPDPPPAGCVGNCAEAGVLGVLPGIIGNLQAMEAIKWIVGIGRPLVGRFLEVDALTMRFREIRVRRDPDCSACGAVAMLSGIGPLSDEAASLARVESSGDGGIGVDDDLEVTALELRERLADYGPLGVNDDQQGRHRHCHVLLVDVREPEEVQPGDPEGLLVPVGALSARIDEVRDAAGRLAEAGAEADAEADDNSDPDPDPDPDLHPGVRAISTVQPSAPVDIVTFCASGVRSLHAARLLREAGFARAVSLRGGVEAWRALASREDAEAGRPASTEHQHEQRPRNQRPEPQREGAGR
ncbi:MAG: molybdopterin-synthase adenylyltransferase MoeB [Planctomycetota bacterium]